MGNQQEFDRLFAQAAQCSRESKLVEAKDIYQYLLENNVGNYHNQSTVLLCLGQVEFYLGNRKQGKALINHALVVDPYYTLAYQWLAHFYWRDRQGYKVPGLIFRYFRNFRGILRRRNEAME